MNSSAATYLIDNTKGPTGTIIPPAKAGVPLPVGPVLCSLVALLPDTDELIEISALHPQTTNARTKRRLRFSRFFTKEQLLSDLAAPKSDVYTWIERFQRNGYGIYWGANPRFTGVTKPAHAKDVSSVAFAFLDFDDCSLSEAVQKLASIMPPPTITVASGRENGGGHVYWKLASPLCPATWDRLKGRLYEAVEGVGLKPDRQCKDVSRILRLPGTVNTKWDSLPFCEIASIDPSRRFALHELVPSLTEEGARQLEAQDAILRPAEKQKWKRAAETASSRPPRDWKAEREEAALAPFMASLKSRPKAKVVVPPVLSSPASAEPLLYVAPEAFRSVFREHAVSAPGQRHERLLGLVIALLKRSGKLEKTTLESAHNQWFDLYCHAMSGQHAKQDSLRDAIEIWESIAPGWEEWKGKFKERVKQVKGSHPGVKYLNGPAHKDHRAIANYVWKGCRLEGGRFFCSYEDLTIHALRIAASPTNRKRAYRVAQQLVKRGVLLIAEKGVARGVKSGVATTWAVEQRYLNAQGEDHAGRNPTNHGGAEGEIQEALPARNPEADPAWGGKSEGASGQVYEVRREHGGEVQRGEQDIHGLQQVPRLPLHQRRVGNSPPDEDSGGGSSTMP